MISYFRGAASRLLTSTNLSLPSWSRGMHSMRPMPIRSNVPQIHTSWGSDYKVASNSLVVEEGSVFVRILDAMNRNARKGKRANKGKRPCSRHRRR